MSLLLIFPSDEKELKIIFDNYKKLIKTSMKKISVLCFILIFSFHTRGAAKKNRNKQKTIKKASYFDHLPSELICMILKTSPYTPLAAVNSLFYALVQETEWYFNKQCNRIIKIIIAYLDQLNHENYTKITNPHFFKKKFTEKKTLSLMQMYFYYLEQLYPRFCPFDLFVPPTPDNTFPNTNYLNADYFKKQKNKWFNIQGYNKIFHYMILKFLPGSVIVIEDQHPQHLVGLVIDKVIKKHKNIIRISFQQNGLDFTQIRINKKSRKNLQKNQTIIHDKNNKTPYSNFYPSGIKKDRKSLATYRTQYDSFFGFPLLLAITTNNKDILAKLMYQEAFLNYLDSNFLTSLDKEKTLHKVKKSYKKKQNEKSVTLLLIFSTDHLLKK